MARCEGTESSLEKCSWEPPGPGPRGHSKHRSSEKTTLEGQSGHWALQPCIRTKLGLKVSIPATSHAGGNSLQGRSGFCPQADTAMSKHSNIQSTSLGAPFLLSSRTTHPSPSIPGRTWIPFSIWSTFTITDRQRHQILLCKPKMNQ